VIKLDVEDQRVIKEALFLFERRNHVFLLFTYAFDVTRRPMGRTLIGFCKCFFNPLILITVIDRCKCIFFPPLNLGSFISKPVVPKHLPLLVGTFLALKHDSLIELTFAKSCAACKSWLCEVHYHEFKSLVLARVAHSEIKPLLMAFGVCVDLHVQPIL
jgi:hypothetical protein